MTSRALGISPRPLAASTIPKGSSDGDVRTGSTLPACQVVNDGLGPGMFGGQRKNARFAGTQSPCSDGSGNGCHRVDGQPLRVLDGLGTDVADAPAQNLPRDRFGYPELVGECSKQLQMTAAREKDEWRRVDDRPISHGRVRDPGPRSLPETSPLPCEKVSGGNPFDPFPRSGPPTLARCVPADTTGRQRPVASPCRVCQASTAAGNTPRPVARFLSEPYSHYRLPHLSVAGW